MPDNRQGEEVPADQLAVTASDMAGSRDEDIDADAIRLDINECELYIDNDSVKDLEYDYFSNVEVDAQVLFGGTLGRSNGGITAFAVSANGKLQA